MFKGMKKWLTCSLVLLLNLAVCGLLAPASTFAQKKPGARQPVIVWEHTFGDEAFVYRPDTIAQTADRQTLLIGGRKIVVGEKGRHATFWLFKVSADGQLLQEVEIARPAYKESPSGASAPRDFIHIRGIVPLSQHRTLVILNVRGEHSMVILDQTGAQRLIKSVGRVKKPWYVFKVLETPDHHLFVIGRVDGDGYLLKMDMAGKEIWSKRFDRGKTETFWDGVLAGASHVVLIGNSYEKFPGSSILSVIKMSTEGVIEQEVQWEGVFGSIAREQGGRFGITYNKSESVKQDIRLRVLDASLTQQWEVQLGTAPMGVEQFPIVAAPGGGFLSGGTLRGSLVLTHHDIHGKETWKFEEPYGETFRTKAQVKLLLSSDAVFIVTRLRDTGKNGNRFKKVSLMKVSFPQQAINSRIEK